VRNGAAKPDEINGPIEPTIDPVSAQIIIRWRLQSQ